jgi:D-threonate/D-erythronate kinase
VIIAIADDFTGAAEMAGIGQSFGLDTLLVTHLSQFRPCELLVIDTNTRSLPVNKAVETIEQFCRDIKAIRLEKTIIFKKIDSILRGHPSEESKVIKEYFNYPLVIFAPANPLKGRKIVGGRYLIENTPLDETLFSRDPEYPRSTSDIGLLLNKHSLNGEYFHLSERTKVAELKGFISIDISTKEDLIFYAEQFTGQFLLVGAAEIFDILLSLRTVRLANNAVPSALNGKNIFIGGSIFNSMDDCEITRGIGNIFYYKTADPEHEEYKIAEDWSGEIIDYLTHHRNVRMAISSSFIPNENPIRFVDILSKSVSKIVDATHFGDVNLLISGGSTASAIIRKLALGPFRILGGLAPGVVVLKSETFGNLTIVVKPGSYPWPPHLKQFLSISAEEISVDNSNPI